MGAFIRIVLSLALIAAFGFFNWSGLLALIVLLNVLGWIWWKPFSELLFWPNGRS